VIFLKNLEDKISGKSDVMLIGDMDIDSDDLDLQLKHLQNDRYAKDTVNRGKLAEWASATVSYWLLFVGTALCVNTKILNLSDSVIITLLTTTTANILVLAVIVLKGYFGHEKNKQ
jgi:hypothetical protein